MNFFYALAIAAIAGCSIHMLLSRHIARIILGVAMLSAAVNLAIFYAGRITSQVPPVIPDTSYTLAAEAANPLPQALILTAIVIGFALISFAAALALQAWRSIGSLDSSELDQAERLGSPFIPVEKRP